MNSKNRFLQTLIAVAALTPTASAVAGSADNETRAAVSDTTFSQVAFASNLSAKLGGIIPDAARPNDVWVGKSAFVRIVFVQSVPIAPTGSIAARMSPIDAFKLASGRG